MTDRRTTPANARVAALHLAGQVKAEKYIEGWHMTIKTPVIDLFASPNGPRDRQLLFGAKVIVFEDHKGFSFVQTSDGYVGYIQTKAIEPDANPTHIICTQATHAYQTDDFKSPDLMSLPFGARVSVINERRKFFETNVGFIAKKHLRPIATPFTDPAIIAQLHYGIPYLWGGNSTRGIDCSGLVSAALTACEIPCPADSDMQMNNLGTDISGSLQRGDLMFWKGHVGMMVDEATLIHANAHHMATAYEPLDAAILRIKAQGDGDVTARKRL